MIKREQRNQISESTFASCSLSAQKNYNRSEIDARVMIHIFFSRSIIHVSTNIREKEIDDGNRIHDYWIYLQDEIPARRQTESVTTKDTNDTFFLFLETTWCI